ncbi:MAG: sigma-70 family RNA polymerase sigma factor [Bacteroidota bacterium]
MTSFSFANNTETNITWKQMNTQPHRELFIKLIQENKRIIFKICNSYCPKREERDDLAQEIVYQLWKSIDDFNPDLKFTTWMYRIALNVAISFYRKDKKTGHIISLEENLMELKDDAETSLETEKNFSLMHQFIGELKEIDKSIVILYLDDKTIKKLRK